MNTFVRSVAILAILLVGCVEKEQDPNAILYEVQISIDTTDSSEKIFNGSMNIGPEGKQVPIQVTWGAKADTTGCLRISHIKIVRHGGDPGTVISKVEHAIIPDCAMKFESEDTTRFQTAIIKLHYEARKFIKTYIFDGSIASILGNGEFIQI
jgi:hypothetical protein